MRTISKSCSAYFLSCKTAVDNRKNHPVHSVILSKNSKIPKSKQFDSPDGITGFDGHPRLYGHWLYHGMIQTFTCTNTLSLSQSPLDIWLEIFLSVLSILGMALLSIKYDQLGFLFLLVGNICGVTLFFRLRLKWMVLSQVFFIAININGIVQSL